MSIYSCNECNDIAFQRLLKNNLVLTPIEVKLLYDELLHMWVKTELTPILRKMQLFLEKQ